MSTLNNPSEIAREALRQLALRRIPPTPDNYRTLYQQISGTSAETNGEAFPERQLRSLISALPHDNPAASRVSKALERAIQQKSWVMAQKAIAELAGPGDVGVEWREFLPTLLREWETRRAGITPARKREQLEHVITGSEEAGLLLTRLKSLVKSWSHSPLTTDSPEPGAANADETVAAARRQTAADALDSLQPELGELLAFTLESVVAAQLEDTPELASEAKAMAARVRAAADPASIAALLPDLKRFAFRLELLSEDRNEIRAGLSHLLQLMIENVGELVVDDAWLHGQIEVVREIVARPLNLRAIDDAERRLKEVIFKQSQLKQSLGEAKQALKTMLAGFVDHLAAFADSTSEYHDKLDACARKISEANDIRTLDAVVHEVIRETRIIQVNAERSRDELQAAKQEVEAAEQRIQQLQSELDHASALVRHDHLTGALNRRGLEEVFEKEIARAARHRSPLCLGVLDIDDFKKLNDALGHQAGDDALVHLAAVIRENLRPQDTVARFGGEEFVILLPDAELEDAKQVIVRLQRDLTKRFFLHDNKKVLITFSAGVTQLPPDGTRDSAIERADELMYQAKRTGKNKVVAA